MIIDGETREPEEGFEALMLAGREGTATMGEVLAAFGDAAIVVPSGADFNGAPENFRPLMFTSAQGSPMMAVFTAMDRVRPFADTAPWMATMSGRNVLANLQDGVGLVINPASALGMEIAPADIARILESLAPLPEGPGPNLAVERALMDGRRGTIGHAEIMGLLSRANMFIATSSTESIVPLVMDYQGGGYAAVFTRPEHMAPFREHAQYGVYTTLAPLAAALTSQAGIVVNPGLDWAYLLQPADVDQLRSE